MSELAPVPPRERVVTLDVLRGLALSGVLIANMALYSGAWAQRGPGPGASRVDEVTELLLAIFVHSKAQTLLTLLFGFGFAVQLLRADERGEPVMGLYARRLAALLVLGALHVGLLWWGDVTWTYAVSGLGLLAFVRASNRARVAWGLGFTFVPFLAMRLPGVAPAVAGVFVDARGFEAHTAQMAAALHRPERAGLAWEHIQYALVWSARIYAWYFLWTLGRFLLGYVAGKLRWFDDDGAGHLPLFRRLAAWSGAIAVVTSTVVVLVWERVVPLPAYGLWGRLAFAVIDQVGLLAMTLAYVGAIVLLMRRPAWRRILRVVAPAGRMPLTTYYAQSLICTFLFYGWGLGWAGSIGTAGCTGIALAIFAAQVALAHLWLRWFRFGPLEWVWRSVVYLKWQPMRAR